MTSPTEWLLKRDRNIGGISTIVLGALGSGKTTLLLTLAKRLINKDITIWRMMYSCQFERFPEQEKVILYFQERDFERIEFIDLKTGEKIKIEERYNTVIAKDFRKLYSKMKQRYLNVLYLSNEDWYAFCLLYTSPSPRDRG